MTHDEQITALQARLNDVNNSISQLNSALAVSTESDERADLSARISQLQMTAETLRTMLNNLMTFAAPMAMAASTTLAPGQERVDVSALVLEAKTSAEQSHTRALELLRLITVPRRTGKPASSRPKKIPRKPPGD